MSGGQPDLFPGMTPEEVLRQVCELLTAITLEAGPERDLIGLKTGDFGNPFRALPAPKFRLPYIPFLDHDKMFANLKENRLYYGLHWISVDILENGRIRRRFSIAAQRAYNDQDDGPFAVARMEKDGPLIICLEHELLQAWNRGSGNPVAGNAATVDRCLIDEEIDASLAGLGWDREQLRKRLKEHGRDLVIEVREQHDFMGETDLREELTTLGPATWNIIIPRKALEPKNLTLLRITLRDELRHVMTGEPDETNTVASLKVSAKDVGLLAMRDVLGIFGTPVSDLFDQALADCADLFAGRLFDILPYPEFPDAKAIFEKLMEGLAQWMLSQKTER
jgi:hypothetical protein